MALTVTGQRQTTIIDDSGNLVQVMAVTARTEKGVSFTIDVPIAQYNRANVERLLTDRATAIDDVHGIGKA